MLCASTWIVSGRSTGWPIWEGLEPGKLEKPPEQWFREAGFKHYVTAVASPVRRRNR